MNREIQYIYDIPKFSRKTSLANTENFIKELGASCPDSKIIHVAGTNGKGSVCEYLNSILRESGYNVGLFTSPHLVDINERIVYNDTMISDEEFEKIFAVTRTAAEKMNEHPSFFEFLFGMAMKYFACKSPDYIILETGLGGRLDATNIIRKPAVCVITSIGLDHMEYLGSTYAEIAAEKAGIIKPDVPVVWMRDRNDVADVITDTVLRHKAISYELNKKNINIIYADDKKIDFSMDNMYYCNECFEINSPAHYQPYNASLAVTAANVLGITDTGVIRRGLLKAFWMGRMQRITDGFIIDGAHNDDGIAQFLDSVRMLEPEGGNVVFFSAVKDKHYEGMIDSICKSGLFDQCIAMQLEDKRGLDVHTIGECFRRGGMPVVEAENIANGCDLAFKKIKAGKNVFAVGSLYFAGEIIRYTRRNNI